MELKTKRLDVRFFGIVAAVFSLLVRRMRRTRRKRFPNQRMPCAMAVTEFGSAVGTKMGASDFATASVQGMSDGTRRDHHDR